MRAHERSVNKYLQNQALISECYVGECGDRLLPAKPEDLYEHLPEPEHQDTISDLEEIAIQRHISEA